LTLLLLNWKKRK